MTNLESLARRIGEIGDEISSLKSERGINLDKCHGSNDEEFDGWWKQEIGEGKFEMVNCLMASYEYVKEGRSHGERCDFGEVVITYGCLNCNAAHNAKKQIGLLKQERGRLVGNISKIGKSL